METKVAANKVIQRFMYALNLGSWMNRAILPEEVGVWVSGTRAELPKRRVARRFRPCLRPVTRSAAQR
ncbi:hypothetical protein GCM10022226_54470 [Sphaerisporangium flaviroseum]|uniref:Uncharacterized protein n=1 Tax=Sphaerisporangium flaviroseum TaxID=509199 RepID=A0ABP7ITR1_9ACTN